MIISFRRVLKQNNLEGWMIYSREEPIENSPIFVDAAVVVFDEEKNRIYLLSDSRDRLTNPEYLTEICNLVHDLPVEFELETKLLQKSVGDMFFDELLKEVPAIPL